MKLSVAQQSILTDMNKGGKLLSTHPYKGLPFKAVIIMPNGMTSNVPRSTFMSLLDKHKIGHPALRTNRQYEYFLTAPNHLTNKRKV